jgi:hypothetical protein
VVAAVEFLAMLFGAAILLPRVTRDGFHGEWMGQRFCDFTSCHSVAQHSASATSRPAIA